MINDYSEEIILNNRDDVDLQQYLLRFSGRKNSSSINISNYKEIRNNLTDLKGFKFAKNRYR